MSEREELDQRNRRVDAVALCCFVAEWTKGGTGDLDSPDVKRSLEWLMQTLTGLRDAELANDLAWTVLIAMHNEKHDEWHKAQQARYHTAFDVGGMHQEMQCQCGRKYTIGFGMGPADLEMANEWAEHGGCDACPQGGGS